MRRRSHQNCGLSPFFNKVIALVGLVTLSPILLVCAILVKLTSDGAVFFKQKRIGLNGAPFTMFKFRTMIENNSGPKVTAKHDTRITWIGAILRKYKLDELPELWNVLVGNMAFVGPRPEVPEMVDIDNQKWQRTLSVPPGITDPVTLYLRNEEGMLATVENKEEFYLEILQPYKLNGYLRYLDRRTWKSDIRVMTETVFCLIKPPVEHVDLLKDGNYRFLEQVL